MSKPPPITCRADPNSWHSCKEPVAWVNIDRHHYNIVPYDSRFYCEKHAIVENYGEEIDPKDKDWITIAQFNKDMKKKEEDEKALEAQYKTAADYEISKREGVYSTIQDKGWISCSDALPELDVEVYISDYRSSSMGYRKSSDLGAFYHIDASGSHLCFIQPSVWMPVIKPPEKAIGPRPKSIFGV